MLNNTFVDVSQPTSEIQLASCPVDLSGLPSDDQQTLIDWNSTQTEYLSHLCIHELVQIQVEKTPHQIALIFETEELTYRELNQRANRLAHYLRSLGVGPDMLVGICLERSVEMIVGLLAILKAGAGYLPLDISYPTERLQYMVENAKAPILITQLSLAEYLPTTGRTVICLDAQKTDHYPDVNLSNPCKPDDLGYVIYTSGSTGKPKGVAMPQRALVNLLHWQNQQSSALESGARTLQFTPVSFDVSFQEIFSTLTTGGILVLIQDDRRRDPAILLRYLQTAKVQRLFLPFVALSQLAEVAKRESVIPEHLKDVITAGEQLRITPEIVDWFRAMPKCRLHNHYGPSESHVVTAFTLSEEPQKWPLLPAIGKPIANTQIYLLNEQMQAVPVGKAGELYIAGDCLARGYLHRPDITAERFITHGNTVLYKTGDLARYLPDGNIEYLGRSDQQIKIRGFRVEPGEIETLLEQHESVKKAVVTAHETSPGQIRLAAYVVAEAGSVESQQLSQFAAAQLPDYMVPSAYVVLEAFPLTPSGKVARRKLPAPVWQRSQTTSYAAPSTPIETDLSHMWAELLDVQEIGTQDTFCSLGGHSLMAVQLIYRIKEHFGVELNLAKFLGEPTIEALAAWIDQIQTQGQLESQDDAIAINTTLDDTIQIPTLPADPIPNYFLTGATGFLGVYMLYDLLRHTRGDIYCLVRAASIPEGFTRLKTSLQHYGLWRDTDVERIIPVAGDLSLPRLGIRQSVFDRLATKLDAIYHCGSWVNVLYPYSSLEAANVGGTQEVLRLASQSRVKPVHYVSTVDVFAAGNNLQIRTIGETGESSCMGPVRSLFSGYAKSKYVAETLMQEAHSRGIPMMIYRPSNIMGDTTSGICSTASFVTKMIQGCIQAGVAPDIDAALNLVPVDYVSRAIVHLSLTQAPKGQAFNIVNPQSYRWNQLVDWMRNQQGYALKQVAYETWCSEVINVVSQDQDHPLFFLTTFFTNLPFIQKSLGAFHFQCSQLQTALGKSSVECAEVGDELLQLYFKTFVEQNLIPAAAQGKPLVMAA
ncbi:MAG: amino acid adenylation domain-containing protein [Cyanobacteria bacterium P01_H01_bin.21]